MRPLQVPTLQVRVDLLIMAMMGTAHSRTGALPPDSVECQIQDPYLERVLPLNGIGGIQLAYFKPC